MAKENLNQAIVSQSEIEIAKFDTLSKIVKQLEGCDYENEASFLKNNVAFIALKRMSENK